MILHFIRMIAASVALLLAMYVNAAVPGSGVMTVEPVQGGNPLPANASIMDGARQSEYAFRVVDQDGNPVEGVYVQFCNDEQCMIDATDAAGAVVFAAEAGEYTAHLLTTPEGYLPNDEEYEIDDGSDETVFTLTRE